MDKQIKKEIQDVVALTLVLNKELKDAVTKDVQAVEQDLSDTKEELNSKIEEAIAIAEEVKKMPGEPGKTPVAGVDFPIPKDGQDYVLQPDDLDVIASIASQMVDVPIVEKVVEVIKEQPIITEVVKNIENPYTLTGENVVNSINNLDEEAPKIKAEHIEGLKSYDAEIATLQNRTQLLNQIATTRTPDLTKYVTVASLTKTTGSVLFAGSDGLPAQDNSNFFWDDTNNRLGIGTAIPSSSIHNVGTSAVILNTQYSTDTTGSILSLQKSRGTEASPSLVVASDTLGELRFQGYDGTTKLQQTGAYIYSTAKIVQNNNNLYGDLRFATRDTSNGLMADRLVFDETGTATLNTTLTTTKAFALTISDATTALTTATAVITVQNTNSALNNYAGIYFKDQVAGDTGKIGFIGVQHTSNTNQGGGDLVFGVKASDSATTLTEYMRVKMGGTYIKLTDGTAAVPAIEFASDSDGSGTGFYRSSANRIGISANGTFIGQFLSTGFEMDSALSFTFNNRGGLNASATNIMRLSAAGGANFDRFIFGETNGTGFSFRYSGTAMSINNGSNTGTTSNRSLGVFTDAASVTAYLHLGAGTATASTSPLKFTSGTLNTTAEAGAVEFLTDKWYATITTGAARKELTLNDAALTSGRVPFATTNGRLTDDADMTFATDTLTVTKISSGTITSTGTVVLKGYTVATLPAGVQGATCFVTDSLAPAFGVAVVGGGAAVAKVWYNGANWTVTGI